LHNNAAAQAESCAEKSIVAVGREALRVVFVLEEAEMSAVATSDKA